MNGMQPMEVTGEVVGSEGTEQLIERAEALCAWERTRIELTNQPVILAKRLECGILVEREREIRERIHRAGPPRETSARKRKIAICWIVASVLLVAGFVLSFLTLEPFRLGMKAIFYCLGIAIVTPFLVERMMARFVSETLLRTVTALACVAALASLMFLAAIRGHLLGYQIHDSSSVVIEGEEQPVENQNKVSFYEETVGLLQLTMILLAFSLEMGAGLAIHEAERLSENTGEDCNELRNQLQGIQLQEAALAKEIVTLENEPARFVAAFWSGFYWSLLKKTLKSAASRLVLPSLLILILFPFGARAEVHTERVIALDLSKSVDAKVEGRESNFKKNIAGVRQVLAQVDPGTHVTVIGITDNSFAQPDILLSARVDSDAGYFGEKLEAARKQLVAAWNKRSRTLTAHYARTDILGVFLLAEQLFRDAPGNSKKEFVIFSDMLQDSKEFAISQRGVSTTDAMRTLKANQLIADLSQVDVYALGVNESSARTKDWISIREFWRSYIATSGGALREYSVLGRREVITAE